MEFKTIKIIVVIIVLPIVSYSQNYVFSANLIPKRIDSIQMSAWDIYTKEMHIDEGIEDYELELKRATLSRNDVGRLKIEILEQSYPNTWAQIHHYNIAFDLFNNSSVACRITISGVNGNIDIENKQTGQKFHNSCPEKLGKFVVHLITKYCFLELFDEYDLERL